LKVKNSSAYKNEFEVTKTGKILWIPEEWHFVNKDKGLCFVETGDSVTAKTELVKGSIFAQTDSLVEVVENNNIVRDIILKPGEQIHIPVK
jgi:DNA-directed RNA polymerase subunit beta'